MKFVMRVLAFASCLLGLTAACDGGGRADAGMDAGFRDSGIRDSIVRDAGADASGLCSEFTPEYCPREYPMSPVPMDAICEVFADMFCRANGNCCERPEEIYPTFAACISDQTARCMDPAQTFEHADALAAGRLDYNSAATGEQRARLGAMSDDCTPVRFGDAIRTAMEGRVASGGACAASAECVDGYRCRADVCVLDAVAGDPCSGHADCVESRLQCEIDMCASRRPDDASCADDEECESLLCVDGACAGESDGAFYCVRQGVAGRAFER